MDDIDRTFKKLRRIDYNTLVSMLPGPVCNPVTFELEYTRYSEPICIAHDWTLKELNTELKKRCYPYE